MSTNPTASTLALRERLDRIQREMIAQRRRADTSTALIVIIGLAMIIGFGWYSHYGYTQIAGLANEPRDMVRAVAVQVNDQLPEVHRRLHELIKTQAPQIAATLSERVKDRIPEAREQFEEYALSQFEGAMVDHSPFENHFATFLSQNKAEVRQAIRQLQKSDKLEPKMMQDLESTLEAQMGGDFRTQCRQALDALVAAKAKLDRLKSGTSLGPDEQMERAILKIARRLRAQEENPASAGMPLTSDIREEVVMRLQPRKPTPPVNGAGTAGGAPTASTRPAPTPPPASTPPAGKQPTGKQPTGKKP